jgi:hypothetical protein
MEMKLATATAQDIQMANDQHYALDSQIRSAISRMTLAGKRVMADKIVDYCDECEKEAK